MRVSEPLCSIYGKWVGLENCNVETSNNMMPIKGLTAEEVQLNWRPLPGKGGNYLSAALLCIWDNIHGPKILSSWSKEQQTQTSKTTSTG